MNLTSVKTIKELLLKYKARPSKIMGQNFLIDKFALSKIIKSADLTPKDIVLEIGPGIGTLTKELAKKAKRVIAIEKDNTMVEILKETLKDFKNVNIIGSDILKINFQFSIFNFQSNHNFQLPKKYKVAANLPYYITSPVIRKFLEMENKPNVIVLMVQKEVAQRICSNPPDMSLLAVSVQFYTKPEIISYVSKKCFWPSPKVDSAIIKISNIKNQKSKINVEKFFRIVRAGFSQPRKQLANNLSKSLGKDKNQINLWLQKNKINPEQRAETLSVSDWKKLTNSYL